MQFMEKKKGIEYLFVSFVYTVILKGFLLVHSTVGHVPVRDWAHISSSLFIVMNSPP